MPARSPRAEARIGDARPSVEVADDPDSGATRVSIFTPDREGLFYRICAGLAEAGANIIDARIHTTRDGMALDNLLVLDGRGPALCRPPAARRGSAKAVEAALDRDAPPPLPAAGAQSAPHRAFRDRAVGGDCRQGLDADHGGRGQCARPARRCWPR